jgi:acyl carrier protein
MEQTDITDRLTAVFHDVFDDSAIVLTPTMTAADIDEWDSLTHIRLVLSVEKAFGLKFSAAEVGALKNVGDFIALIARKSS